jgi:diguanylate cyclase (GGDEF)-like protein
MEGMALKRRIESRTMIIWAYTILILLCIPMLIAAHSEGYSANTYTSHASSRVSLLDTRWISVNADGSTESVSLPIRKAMHSDQPLILRRALSANECKDGKYLMLLSYHSAVRIYIDGVLMYDYHTTGKLFPLEPSAYHFFALKPDYAGRTITIVQDSISAKFQGTSEVIRIGDKASEILLLLRKNAASVCSYTLLFTIAILFFLVWVFIKLLSRDYCNNSLLYLASIAFFMFIGGINDTKLTQLIFSNTEALCILNYEVIYFMEMCIVAYFLCSYDSEIVHVNKKIAFIPAFNFIVCNVLALTKLVNLEDSLIITHISLLSLAVCEVAVNLRTRLRQFRSGNTSHRMFPETAGFLFFAFTVCVDIIRYYQGNKTDYAAYTRLGVIVFIMMLGIRSLTDYIDVEAIKRQSQMYRQMAMHDVLTGLNNRTSYHEAMEKLDSEAPGTHSTIIAMFDLNNLKNVNDMNGHEAGDVYITSCASFINSFFKDFATLYRIGGDEFALICATENTDRFIKSYEEMKRRYAESKRTEINFAYGYAKYDPRSDTDLYDTAKRADHQMYECKAEMKRSSVTA